MTAAAIIGRFIVVTRGYFVSGLWV
jgi:hypothetical protein